MTGTNNLKLENPYLRHVATFMLRESSGTKAIAHAAALFPGKISHLFEGYGTDTLLRDEYRPQALIGVFEAVRTGECQKIFESFHLADSQDAVEPSRLALSQHQILDLIQCHGDRLGIGKQTVFASFLHDEDVFIAEIYPYMSDGLCADLHTYLQEVICRIDSRIVIPLV